MFICFPQVLVVIGHELLLAEIVHSVYSKSMAEGFPEPHSQNYSCNCDLALEFQNYSATHRNSSIGYCRCCKKLHHFNLKGLCCVNMPKTEMKQLI